MTNIIVTLIAFICINSLALTLFRDEPHVEPYAVIFILTVAYFMLSGNKPQLPIYLAVITTILLLIINNIVLDKDEKKGSDGL